MLIVVSFILNSALNFLLGLCIAGVLGPEFYGRFSVAFTGAMVLYMLLFDWLRLSATRFYSEDARDSAPSLRASLNLGYVVGSGLLVAGAGLLASLGFDIGLSAPMIAAIAFVAIAYGFFDFFGALLRARFRNGAYSGLVILKNLLSFAAMLGAAWFWRDPTLVMLAAALSTLAATLALNGQATDPQARLRQASGAQMAVYLRYGAPIVLANIFYQAIILANRSFAAAHLDFAAAGQLSLPTDMCLRLMLAVGAALDILLFQLAVHKRNSEGVEAAQRQVARNSLAIFAIMVLLCVGYVQDMPAFAALVAPEKFRADFGALSVILAPGVALFCIGQFCLNPIAQLEGRTGRVALAALASAALDLSWLALLPPRDLAGYAWAHSVSLGGGFVMMLALTWRWRAYWPRLRDLAGIAGAGAAAALAMQPLHDLKPALLALSLTAAIGGGVFFALLLLFNPAGEVRPLLAKARAKLGRSSERIVTEPASIR